MRIYFTVSFLLFAVLAGLLTMNWWLITSDDSWPLRVLLGVVGVVMTLGALGMAVVSAGTRYRS